MIKATGTHNGRKVLMIGLSFGNLGKFLAEPLDTFIKIDGKEMNLPFDVMIFSGQTEADMQEFMSSSIGPGTVIHVDPKMS